MRVLLFNDNPVVTKLVTLSAQKTGDELEVCSDFESLKSSEVDLLIVDDGLYNDESAIALGISVTASQHLFMANRGSTKPEGFEHTINKPFLPTDLVELFTMISNSLGSASDDSSDDEVDMQISMDDDSLELESLDDELTLDTQEMEDEIDLEIGADLDTLDDLGALDLDEIEAENGSLIDIDDTLEADTTEDESLVEEIQESVLDKDDLAEVQSLLEDADNSLEDTISVGSLDNFDDLGLDIDDEALGDIEEDSDEISDELNLEDEELVLDDTEEDELLDLNLEEEDEALELEETSANEEIQEEELMLNDIEEDELLDLNLEEEVPELEETSANEEIQEEELALDDIEEDELSDLELEEEAPAELIDDDALNNLEDEIQSAISELSDEELEESVDEDILLDIVSSDESLATFSGLDDLDEQSLKVAVGEAEASDVSEDIVEDISEDDEILESNDIDIVEKSTKLEGVEALKTLLKALENDDVVNSLKGMNININISFGGDS